jgi:hypothetical protein
VIGRVGNNDPILAIHFESLGLSVKIESRANTLIVTYLDSTNIDQKNPVLTIYVNSLQVLKLPLATKCIAATHIVTDLDTRVTQVSHDDSVLTISRNPLWRLEISHCRPSTAKRAAYALVIANLDATILSVTNDDPILAVHGHSTRAIELEALCREGGYSQ